MVVDMRKKRIREATEERPVLNATNPLLINPIHEGVRRVDRATFGHHLYDVEGLVSVLSAGIAVVTRTFVARILRQSVPVSALAAPGVVSSTAL